MADNYSNIDKPYDDFLQRGEGDADNGSVEKQAVKNDGSMGDVWIRNFIRSDNWKPRSVGFYLNGETGYAEFTNVYVSGNIQALTGTIGGFTIDSTSLSVTSGGNTTTISSGATAFLSGPTGSPTVTITQAGALTATSGTIGGWTLASTGFSSGSVNIKSTAEQVLLGSATAPTTGTGIFIGLSAAVYQFRAGDPTAAYMLWNGSALSIVGGTITAGTIQTASSGARITLSSSAGIYTMTAINSSSHTVMTLKYDASGAGSSVLKLFPQDTAAGGLYISIPSSFSSGSAADAIPITILNLAASTSIFVDGGDTCVSLLDWTISAIVVNGPLTPGSETGPGVDLIYGGGVYPVIDMDQGGTSANSYGIRITQNSGALKEGLFVDGNANSNLAECIYLDRDGNSASDVHAMIIESANAGAGAGVGIDLSGSGHAFTFASDITAAGAYKGRIPVRVVGATKYIHYFDA